MKAMDGHPAEVLDMICGFANGVADEHGTTEYERDGIAGAIIGFCLQIRNHALGEGEIDQMPTAESVHMNIGLQEAWKKEQKGAKS